MATSYRVTELHVEGTAPGGAPKVKARNERTFYNLANAFAHACRVDLRHNVNLDAMTGGTADCVASRRGGNWITRSSAPLRKVAGIPVAEYERQAAAAR